MQIVGHLATGSGAGVKQNEGRLTDSVVVGGVDGSVVQGQFLAARQVRLFNIIQ